MKTETHTRKTIRVVISPPAGLPTIKDRIASLKIAAERDEDKNNGKVRIPNGAVGRMVLPGPEDVSWGTGRAGIPRRATTQAASKKKKARFSFFRGGSGSSKKSSN